MEIRIPVLNLNANDPLLTHHLSAVTLTWPSWGFYSVLSDALFSSANGYAHDTFEVRE